jgi:anthranilate phosphoribosyltransferase
MRKALLEKATAGRPLSFEEAREAGEALAAGRTEPLVTAAFLAGLAARGETAEELAGMASAFRRVMVPLEPCPGAVDTCGTGGDAKGTFNLSTAAALTAAALGVMVAKHGNRSISSACGSADLLERAGYPLDEAPERASRRLRERGFAFLFAPAYHPAMAHVAPVRRALGVRTAFNLLGPLLNPARVSRQVVGVFSAERMELMALSLRALGTQRALVVHGEGGYDEAILHGRTFVLEARAGSLDSYDLGPADFGLPQVPPEGLRGGSPAENARLFDDLLLGRGDAGLTAAVAANAALALRAAGKIEDLREGAALALEHLRGGRVGSYVESLLAGPEEEEDHAQVS